jgi:Domain of unknown function (DUF932)
MPNAQLLSHVDTDLVTRDQLRLVPVPEATRTWRPIPHIELVESLEEVLQQNQIAIQGEEFALRRDGSTLFGVLQLVYENTSDGRAAMGIRTSNNKTMSIQICAGLSVFVCDNLVFRGDLIALNRKHTSGLVLRTEISNAVLRFQEHFGRLTSEIDRLRARELTDPEAKGLIHDVFVAGVLPVRFLPQVSEMYFAPPFQEWAGRNAWSLHNAFTAAAKQMPMSTRLGATQELGRLFGMSENADDPRSPKLLAA